MLALNREKLLRHLQRLPAIINAYSRHEIFLDRVLEWLNSLEGDLLKLRNPLASFVAVEKGKILAVQDGLIDRQIIGEGISKRKALRATAVSVLLKIESVIQKKVQKIDTELNERREKMASFLGAVTVDIPIPLPPTEPRNEWLKKTWKSFGTHTNTKALYKYLNYSLSASDRLYLLEDLIQNYLSDNPVEEIG